MGGNEDGGGFVAEEGGREGRKEKSSVVQFLPTKIRVVAPSCVLPIPRLGGGLKTTMYALVCGAGFE